jgi:hypothetical protein
MHLNEAALEIAGLRTTNEKLLMPPRALGSDGLYPSTGTAATVVLLGDPTLGVAIP